MARPTIHVVRRARAWYRDCGEGMDGWSVLYLGKDRGVLRAFASARRAERFRARLEERRRRRVPRPRINPFVFLDYEMRYEDITSFPEPVLEDWLREADLEPPGPSPPWTERRPYDWVRWWEKGAPKMTREQRAHVWKALDRVNFYEVVELPLE